MVQLKDIVRFRGDRLFNGAVSIDWFWTDECKRRAAAESFVFHGPTYHGVTQKDVGTSHGHHLLDTANFTQAVIHRCLGLEEQPFTLAIAGYGTGKSHLALTLATLLSNPSSPEAEKILQSINSADAAVGSDLCALLQEEGRPFLVVALNGMQNFDLTAQVTRQILAQVRAKDFDTRILDELRPRFGQAVSLMRMSSDSVITELLTACELGDKAFVLDALEKQDEQVYTKVHAFFSSKGMPIRALGGESISEVFQVVAREYCGEGKPFARLVILFDEFGRYTEFATIRSQIAGSGVLQDMFEGVQDHADTVSFIGFIQFELNAYVQRVAAEFKNDILRYVTRYQTAASKAYLSINLETLIAHLLEKQDPDKLDTWFDHDIALEETNEICKNLQSWFPQSRNYRLWSDPEQFHTVIRKGCWPLSPIASWLLFYLTAAGKHLQERSSLSLLGDVFEHLSETEVPDNGSWSLVPVDLWSNAFQEELIASEESGQQGSITHAYLSIIARHKNQINEELMRLLRAIVLSSKLGLQVEEKDSAIAAIAEISGVPLNKASDGIAQLQDDYNVIEWDQSFRQFDILGDAVPRTQFLSFIRQRVASSYDEEAKAALFASKAQDWCDLLGDIECDFAEDNYITTREWRYEAVTSTLQLLETNLKFAARKWSTSVAVDDSRGTVVYCYVEQSRDSEVVTANVRRLLRQTARESEVAALPVFVVLLYDEEGMLGQILAELSILEDSLTEEDRAKFGNLVGAHIEKARQTIRTQVEDMIRRRQYVTALSTELEAHRLGRFGTELFAQIYKKPMPFPFDGFSTARGNAADSCQQLITELLQATLDYDSAIAKPAKTKNRAINVLHSSWGVFTKTGSISRRPSHPVVRTITEQWDKTLQSEGQQFMVGQKLRQVCLPPYGANIASAGLLLGVYIAPRGEKLTVIRHGQQYAIKQWLQDGVFRAKFLDISALDNDELVLIGEESSEWEELLDEWEQAESYLERSNYLKRANELKERVPVPPLLGYRFVHFEELAKSAADSLQKNSTRIFNALSKIVESERKNDIGKISWGAVDLLKIKERMINERSHWTKREIQEPQPHFDRARQLIIQGFSAWLNDIYLTEDTPEAVGDFKHIMLKVIGGNLKKLDLDNEFQQLEKRVGFLIRNAETTTEAHQLVRNVNSWLDEHTNAFRIARIAEIRGLRDVGKTFSSQLQGMTRRINIPEINDVRIKLSDFLTKLSNIEADVLKRAKKLWRSKVHSKEDVEILLTEIENLIIAFEGCNDDLEDFRLMHRALKYYHNGYLELQNERLTWSEFESLSANLQKEAESNFGDAELPWIPDEIISGFAKAISNDRKDKSLKWIRQIESEAKGLSEIGAVEASKLYERAIDPPPWLTDQHTHRLDKLIRQIEARLEILKIDWLVQKFKELPLQAKKKFLKIVSNLAERR